MSKARDLAGLFNLNPTSGTTAQRPATADVGEIYYNGTTGKTQIYTPTGWQDMASGIPYGNTAGRPTAVTGQPYFNGETNRLELYTAGSGWQNIIQEVPGVASITGNYSEATNSGSITIAGTNFVTGAIASAIGTNGVEIQATSTTYNSLVQLTAVFTGLSNAFEPYDIKVTNPSNLFGLIPDALYVNASPVWQTASGSLGTLNEQVSITLSALSSTDSDSTTITYALASGSTLPSGVTLNSSTGVISGTLPNISADTTYTFTINASDGLNTIPRAFSITSSNAINWSTTAGSLGTFYELSTINLPLSAVSPDSATVTYALASGSSLPSGVSLNSSTGTISGTLPNIATDTTYTFTINALQGPTTTPREFSISSSALFFDYLIVGGGGSGGWDVGGGGGAGGLLAGTFSVTSRSLPISVGLGGAAITDNSQRNNGGDTSAFSLVAYGGGAGGNWRNPATYGANDAARNGGAGGSGGGGGGWSQVGYGGSGTTGQGFAGGNATTNTSPSYGGGGGGAGGPGSNGTAGDNSQIAGGPGVASSITGTSIVYASGGKGGGDNTPDSSTVNGTDGLGNGGDGEGVSARRRGGSGVVVIAYPNTSPALSNIPGTLTYDQPTRSGYRVYRFTAGSGTVTF